MSHIHSVSLLYGSCVHCGWKIGTSTDAWDWADMTCKSDLERVLEHYTQDRDAGHEEPWAASYADLIAEAYKGSALEYWNGVKAQWGAERALYSRQLQDANKRIHELEAELRKMREDMRKLMHAAAHPPQIEDEPVAFPARALRFSV